MAENNDGGLYLIVGGLLVAAIVFGFVVWGRSGTTSTSYTNIAPAAGTPSSYSSSTTTDKSTNTTSTPDESGYGSSTEQRSTTTTTHTP
ncbi:MAG TPA: hypothetical protein VL625_13155 [Patescibacteria group bacterium]|jgi:cytoskeletal protein RodZ|nr:hypothetical protein [Patescibacteria group bacterium]